MALTLGLAVLLGACRTGRRADLDLQAATVRVERTQVEVAGRVSEGPTKSRAGRRVVAFPPALVPLSGTAIRDLMSRMGRDSTRAALIYLHGSTGAARAIADAMPMESPWHDRGTRIPGGGDNEDAEKSVTPPDVGRRTRAGDGNRTRMASLEGGS